ncbi:hypothetical protein [Marinoscillum sp.]|uniref:hypothetical protein n=1 Tax=Marinoscillum sp. TaxID=2024838 RepID=UPI003BAC5D60
MRKLSLLFLVVLLAASCTVNDYQSEQEVMLKRMPFNERVFLLNSVSGESRIYELDYDFQGLASEAVLNRLETESKVPAGGHMTMSPDNEWLTVVVAKVGKIFLVNVNSGEVRTLMLYNYNPDGMYYDEHYENRRFEGAITQVDVDEEGFLFIAGKSGFFKVVADNGDGKADPSNVNVGSDIWSDVDASLCSSANSGLGACGEVWVHAVPFTFSGDAYVESTDDGEDYFEDAEEFNSKRVKFLGGDILFTQNSTETDGFEAQRLISFSQWKNNTAIALDLTWDWTNKEISFTASKIFGGDKNNPFATQKTGKVTGAALTGDNFVFTSHHKKDFINLWNLHGDLITKVQFTINDPSQNNKFKDGKTVHYWGDMASTQSFDKNSQNPSGSSTKEIPGQYSQYWDFSSEIIHQYAEIKLYRPGSGMDDDPNNMSEEDYNATSESRSNAANVDIADYNKNGSKFVSLGKENGYALLRFQNAIEVGPRTTLQVVETSWNKQPSYTSLESAFSAYPESAKVYVLRDELPRYYTSGLEVIKEGKSPGHDWVLVGTAGIAGNLFELDQVDGLEGHQFQWVMVVDSGSTTPDGYDLNFVSAYDGLDIQ